MKKWLKIAAIITPVLLFSSACDTSNGYEIPYVLVDLHLGIYGELGNPAIGSSVEVQGGVNGIIIYREDFDIYHAYDRTCTLWPEHNEQVVEDAEFEGVYVCPECESQYLLLLGADPISGPAAFPLKKYHTVIDGGLLHVYN